MPPGEKDTGIQGHASSVCAIGGEKLLALQYEDENFKIMNCRIGVRITRRFYLT